MELNEPLPISMQFRANEKTSTAVYEDEPLILSVAIVNDGAVQAASYNASLEIQRQELERKFNTKQIKEEEFKRRVTEIEQRKLKLRIYRLGGPKGWTHFIKFYILSEDIWKEVNWPLNLLTFYPHTKVAELDASTSCYVEFGLDPQDTSRLPQGEFHVKARAEMVEGKSVESNIVIVNLLREKLPEAKENEEETLLSKARYYYKKGIYDEAREFVDRALLVNPQSIQSLILLGDIEEGRKNLSIALSTYEKALDEFQRQYPDSRGAPRSLVSKINRLRVSKGR